MPNEEEIRKIMEKAKKAASGGKGSPQKKLKVKSDSGGTGEKKDQPSPPLPEEKKRKPEVPKESPETVALRNSIDRLTDVVGKLETRLTNTETKTEVINPGRETGKTGGAAQEELTPEQELKMLQDAQAQQQATQGGGETGQGQAPVGPGNPLYIYLLGKTLDTVGKVLPAALQRGGGEGAGGKPTLSSLAEEWLIAQIKNQIMGGGGGGGNQNISIEAMKTMSNFQGMLLGSFFNTIKNLPKPMAEKIIGSAIETGGIKEPIE